MGHISHLRLRGIEVCYTRPPVFRSCLLCPNGWMDEELKTPLGTEVDLGPSHVVLDGTLLPLERGTAPPLSFRPMSIVATVAHLTYC